MEISWSFNEMWNEIFIVYDGKLLEIYRKLFWLLRNWWIGELENLPKNWSGESENWTTIGGNWIEKRTKNGGFWCEKIPKKKLAKKMAKIYSNIHPKLEENEQKIGPKLEEIEQKNGRCKKYQKKTGKNSKQWKDISENPPKIDQKMVDFNVNQKTNNRLLEKWRFWPKFIGNLL